MWGEPFAFLLRHGHVVVSRGPWAKSPVSFLKQIAYDAFQGQQRGALSDACRFHGAGSLVPSWTPLGALPLLLTYTVALFVLTSLSVTVIMHEIKFNDMSPVTQKTLRILTNKSILFAGLTLTTGFRLERALMVLGQVALFLMLNVSQFLTNRRIENQMVNGYGTSWQGVVKYLAVSCVTGLSGGLMAMHVLASVSMDEAGFVGMVGASTVRSTVRSAVGAVGAGVAGVAVGAVAPGSAGPWGLHAHTFVCALDACSLMVFSFQGMMMYFVRMLSVVCTVSVRVKGGRRIVVKRKPTAEMAFYTEVQGLVDAVLELGVYGAGCMEYAVAYLFRDGVFVHVFDLAILLDLRYMIAHSKRRMARYHTLHKRAQFVTGVLVREIGGGGGDRVGGDCVGGEVQCRSACGSDPSLECAICMEDINVGRRLHCGHVFHLKCLLGWIKECDGERCTCPLCRSDLMGAAGDASDSCRGASIATFAPMSGGFLTDDDIDLNDGRFFQ
jgi:hypothetical protein